ncbi:MAG: reverse transcriptase domain-containing protein [Burkholderiales bacterium]|nr:reverse transcriptase domain-containing protein [Burkholderiales bacterium]
MLRYRTNCDDGSRAVWNAEDVIVIKAISLVLTEYLKPKLSKQCTHLSGNGGIQAAITSSRKFVQNNTFFFKTDIASFYSSINHDILCNMLANLIDDKALLSLIYQTIRRTESLDGYVNIIRLGIPLGSPLSPLLAGVFLLPIDKLMVTTNYIRFMDDYVFFTNS